MSLRTDRVARAARDSIPEPAPQVRLGIVADMRYMPAALGPANLTLFVDFGSGGNQCASAQHVLDGLVAMEAANSGSAYSWVVGKQVLTLTPPGNGMPWVTAVLGSAYST